MIYRTSNPPQGPDRGRPVTKLRTIVETARTLQHIDFAPFAASSTRAHCQRTA